MCYTSDSTVYNIIMHDDGGQSNCAPLIINIIMHHSCFFPAAAVCGQIEERDIVLSVGLLA